MSDMERALARWEGEGGAPRALIAQQRGAAPLQRQAPPPGASEKRRAASAKR